MTKSCSFFKLQSWNRMTDVEWMNKLLKLALKCFTNGLRSSTCLFSHYDPSPNCHDFVRSCSWHPPGMSQTCPEHVQCPYIRTRLTTFLTWPILTTPHWSPWKQSMHISLLQDHFHLAMGASVCQWRSRFTLFINLWRCKCPERLVCKLLCINSYSHWYYWWVFIDMEEVNDILLCKLQNKRKSLRRI